MFASAMLLSVMLIFSMTAYAQYDPCEIPVGVYCSRTQGGWGAPCAGNNAGCLLRNNFATVFPAGLTIGGTFTMHFDSSGAIREYLPAGETAGVLTANLNNPLTSPAGVFGGQVTALAINVAFSDAGVGDFNPNLGNLIIPNGVHSPAGPFAGWTVYQILALANDVLGGNTGALPGGISLTDLNSVVDGINNNFDSCHVSLSYLVEEECDEELPVEISAFDAAAVGTAIRVHWRTASEQDVIRFELSRSKNDGEWSTVASIEGLGNSPTGHDYRYDDGDVTQGVTYSYRLIVHELSGAVTVHSQVASATLETVGVPTTTALHQNYPNPFNPSTTIRFDLAEPSHVRLGVFDVTGRAVAELMNGDAASGSYSVRFDASALSAGTYFYRLEAGSFTAIRRLMLIK